MRKIIELICLNRHPSFIHMLAWCMTFSLCSCSDDYIEEDRNLYDSNKICFEITAASGAECNTRAHASLSNDTSTLLKPLVLRSSHLEQPLYLHTYIAEEYERSDMVETRGTQTNTAGDFFTTNKKDGFAVTACFKDNNQPFINAYAVVKPYAGKAGNTDNTLWITNPDHYYWPNNERMLCFSAFAPKSAEHLLTNLSVTNTSIDFDYTVPSDKAAAKAHDAEMQPDIMFAYSECNKATSADEKVPLEFRHALSAVKFAIRDVVGGKIEKISIANVIGKGHCNYANGASGTRVFTWNQYGKADCSYSQQFDYATTENSVPNPSTNDGSSDIVINNTMPEKTFLLIPQVLNDNAYIEITFRRDIDNNLFTLKGKIKDNLVTEWEPGKEYVYTISTSTSNWIYHLDVIGSNQSLNDDNPKEGVFSDKEGSIIINQTVTEGAYYKVRSYRERANNLKQKELVAWNMVTSNGTSQIPADLQSIADKYSGAVKNMVISPDKWIPVKTIGDNGSYDLKKYNVVFTPQMTGTSWEGDWEMRTKTPRGTVQQPVDLSMVNGTMNTANCYVINGPGYYKLPLVYGNAITDGKLNKKCYEFTGNDSQYYSALRNFTDYKGNAINGAKINGAADAVLVWDDAYELISDVKLNPNDGKYGTLSFKINDENLQQGNAVLAIRDADKKIMWSWHIWASEHWVNDNLILGKGDVKCTSYDNYYPGHREGFTFAPYNLGWCDPKDEWFLKRTGTMTFTQDKSNKKVVLNVEQREKMVEYWIGNNTYYQFGRKDPIVGFMNNKSVVKYNFGPYPYKMEVQLKSISYSIQNPNILFVGINDKDFVYNDWVDNSYYNLWNNSSQTLPQGTQMPEKDNLTYYYSGVKTVYDPSPAGYQIPPVGFFKLFTNALHKDQNAQKSETDPTLDFNGEKGPEYKTHEAGYFDYYTYSKKNYQGTRIRLTPSGHRWYADWNNGFLPGQNFNPQLVYLWSNQVHMTYSNKSAYGLALGINVTANNTEYVSNFRFVGRRAMARPVRPVKIFNR